MARVKSADLFDQFAIQMRQALDEAVEKTLPGTEVDRQRLYREFRRSLAARCKAWENVPNQVVDAD